MFLFGLLMTVLSEGTTVGLAVFILVGHRSFFETAVIGLLLILYGSMRGAFRDGWDEFADVKKRLLRIEMVVDTTTVDANRRILEDVENPERSCLSRADTILFNLRRVGTVTELVTLTLAPAAIAIAAAREIGS